MSLNVIDLIKGQLGPALITQSATQMGESESGISKAISALLPAVVGGLSENTEKPGVVDAITGATSSGLLGNLLGSASGNSMVATVLNAIFGDRVPGLVNAVSGYSGVSNTSANSLLYMVTGAAIGSIGKYAEDNNLGTSGVADLLKDQQGVVSSLLPAGLSLASLGVSESLEGDGLPHAENIKVTSYDDPKVEVNRGGNTHVHVDKNDEHKDTGSIWKWLLPLLLLALAAWFLWKQCDKPADQTSAVSDSAFYDSDSASILVDSATLGGSAAGVDSLSADSLASPTTPGSTDSAGVPVNGTSPAGQP